MKKYLIKLRNFFLVKGFINPKVKHLNIFMTNKCNFLCWYCNRNIDENTEGVINKYIENSEFKYEDFKYLLNKYKSIKRVSLIGIGEPFLNKDIIKIAKYAKQKRKKVYTVTNGSLLHNYFGEIGNNFDSISISIHGVGAEKLKENAKVDEKVYHQIIKNIKYLVENEIKSNPKLIIRASVVFIKNDIENIKKSIQFCIENKINILDVQNYIPNNLEDVENCLYDDDTFYINELNKILNDYSDKIKINLPVLIKRNEKAIKYNCHVFFNTLRVDGNGNVESCTVGMVPKYENGNIREDEKVWENDYFKNMRKKFKNKKDLPKICRYCRNSQ